MECGFESMPFKGTTVSLDDFNKRYGFDFRNLAATHSEDDLLLLCEYVLNFAIHLNDWDVNEQRMVMIEHVRAVADKLMHRFAENEDGLCELVPIDSRVLAAAEIAPEEVAVDLIHYDYRGLKGDLEGKRAILSKLCRALEPKRGKLKKLTKGLESDLFYIANNLNIRHNNTDPADPGKYQEHVAKMQSDNLETLYDELHGMCAAALLLLEYGEKADVIRQLKEQ